MSFYLDASVVVPSLIAEPTSSQVKRWLSELEASPALSDLAYGEVLSALYRAVREGRERLEDVMERAGIFDRWYAAVCTAPSHVPSDMQTAISHVRRFDLALRMPDALHLAACARLGMTLATFDRRLLRAAETLGIAAVRPS